MRSIKPKMSNRHRLGLLLLPAVLATGPVARALDDAEAMPDLFELAPAPPQGFQDRPYVVQSRAVLVHFPALSALVLEDELNLNLFSESMFTGVVERVDRRSQTRYTVAGRLAGVEFSSFIIVVEEDVAVAMVEAPTLRLQFKLGYVGDGVHEIAQINNARFPKCGNEGNPNIAGPRPKPERERAETQPPPPPGGVETNSCARPRSMIDVMIVYTTMARQAAGGLNAINAECQLAVDEANVGYVNSRIAPRLRLVFRVETGYGENGDFDDHLDRITDPDDGVMDNVHTLRNAYHVDLVSLWVNDDDDGEICGLAHCDVDEEDAFSVVNWDCAVSNFSFQHEIGHNQGCAHDDDNCGFPCFCANESYSYGWRFFGNDGNGYRTVMSYNNDANDYMRINWFSNPGVSFQGQPTGVRDDAENFRTINDTRLHVQRFRSPAYDVWVDFAYRGTENGEWDTPFNTVAEGESRIVNGALVDPILWINPGSTNETPRVTRPMDVRTCGGLVRIGG